MLLHALDNYVNTNYNRLDVQSRTKYQTGTEEKTMEEKASDAKVKFLGGHVEALVKESISCGVSRGEVIELFLTYWEKEQKKILESKEQLKKKEERNEKILSYPMEEFIKNAIRQNVCKSSAKNCISKHWDKVLTLSESGDPQRELVHFSSFEISCVQLIVSAINNQIFKSQLLEMLDNSWDKIYRMEKLPVESEEEKEFKEKVRKYVNNPTSGLFWFINALDYSTAQTPQFVTGKTSSLHLYYHIGMKLQVKTVPKGMYWQITEEKYEPVIFVHTSLAEEILWAMKFVYSSNDGKNISPEKIVSKAMKRLDKIYNRWDENIKDDIRKLIKLLRLYVHEIKASEECQKAMDSMVNEESKYLDKAIIRLIWEVEHN